MRSRLTISGAAATAVFAVAIGGCATQASRDAAYEQALGPWRGAGEDALVARWGPPQSRERIGAGTWLVFTVKEPFAAPAPTVGFGVAGYGGGGRRAAAGFGIGAEMPVGTVDPLVCTTRFLIENGRVSAWSFDGNGCGTMR